MIRFSLLFLIPLLWSAAAPAQAPPSSGANPKPVSASTDNEGWERFSILLADRWDAESSCRKTREQLSRYVLEDPPSQVLAAHENVLARIQRLDRQLRSLHVTYGFEIPDFSDAPSLPGSGSEGAFPGAWRESQLIRRNWAIQVAQSLPEFAPVPHPSVQHVKKDAQREAASATT